MSASVLCDNGVIYRRKDHFIVLKVDIHPCVARWSHLLHCPFSCLSQKEWTDFIVIFDAIWVFQAGSIREGVGFTTSSESFGEEKFKVRGNYNKISSVSGRCCWTRILSSPIRDSFHISNSFIQHITLRNEKPLMRFGTSQYRRLPPLYRYRVIRWLITGCFQVYARKRGCQALNEPAVKPFGENVWRTPICIDYLEY